ncbi:hypothetical protein [Escherichia coli]|uniref:hypothetical protein n=1 Tax=Escherichia coli TaxID=562 RepID=UPI00202BB27E|nr:hypothetical protein [Escherichia coli]
MNINKRWLNFVLSDDGGFDELIIKTEQAFKHKLICIDDEGVILPVLILMSLALE